MHSLNWLSCCDWLPIVDPVVSLQDMVGEFILLFSLHCFKTFYIMNCLNLLMVAKFYHLFLEITCIGLSAFEFNAMCFTRHLCSFNSILLIVYFRVGRQVDG